MIFKIDLKQVSWQGNKLLFYLEGSLLLKYICLEYKLIKIKNVLILLIISQISFCSAFPVLIKAS